MSEERGTEAANDRPYLVPEPRSVVFDGGSCDVPRGMVEDLDVATVQTEEIEGLDLIQETSVPRGEETSVPRGGAAHGGYRLEITPSSFRIFFSDWAGRWNGFQTLRQLVAPGHGRVPLCRIEDSPDLAVRGVLLDISRNRVPTMGTLFRLVEQLSRIKINHLQLYTEHTFAYQRHREVWQGASPLTAEEVRTLDRYCSDRGIELVPNQNSVGHMERWLRHPQYRHLAESPQGFEDPWGIYREHGSSLSPAVESTRTFLGGLYDELLPNFESTTLNVGGDEPWELCGGRSRDLCAERGKGRVYLDFLTDIHRLLTERNVRMMFFGDIITQYPELIPEIPRDAIVVDWGYESDHPFDHEARLFEEAGIDYLVCAGTSSWNSFGGRWTNARENIRNAARAATAHGALGLIVSDWGDNGHLQQLPISYPGFSFAAAVSWNVEQNENIDVAAAVSAAFFAYRYGPAGDPDRVGPAPTPSPSSPPALPTTPIPAHEGEALARTIIKVGDLYLGEPCLLGNATVLAALAIPGLRPYYESDLAACGGSNLEGLVEEVASVRQEIESFSATVSGSSPLELEEMRFTVRFLAYAAELACLTLGVRNAKPAPVSSIPTAERAVLRKEMKELARWFVLLWRRRSRPGGLEESLSVLEHMAEELEDHSA